MQIEIDIASQRKRTRLLWYVVLVLLSAGLIFAVIRGLLPPSRDDYRVINFNNEPWQREFWREYQGALANDSYWVKDPQVIALRIAGYPNTDNIPPEDVRLSAITSNKVIVIVNSGMLMDDSISRIETRVELIQRDSEWEVEWAGQRQQCYRGLGIGWTVSTCP